MLTSWKDTEEDMKKNEIKSYEVKDPRTNQMKIIGFMGKDKLFVKNIDKEFLLRRKNAYPIENSVVEELTKDGCKGYVVNVFDCGQRIASYTISWKKFLELSDWWKSKGGWEVQKYVSLDNPHWTNLGEN